MSTPRSGSAGRPPEPGRVEVLAAPLFTNVLLSPLYRRYVDQMGLRGDERVLDYGSGSGAAARHLAKRLRAGGGRLTCMDVSARWQKVLRRVLRAYPDVEFRLGDVRTMGLPEASFDVVLVHWMLHDVPPRDRPAIVAELARLLRPGGGCSRASPRAPSTACRRRRRERCTPAPASASLSRRRASCRSSARTTGPSGPGLRPDLRLECAGRQACDGPEARPHGRRRTSAVREKAGGDCRRPPLPPPLRGSPETPPDSGSGISVTNERGQTFRAGLTFRRPAAAG